MPYSSFNVLSAAELVSMAGGELITADSRRSASRSFSLSSSVCAKHRHMHLILRPHTDIWALLISLNCQCLCSMLWCCTAPQLPYRSVLQQGMMHTLWPSIQGACAPVCLSATCCGSPEARSACNASKVLCLNHPVELSHPPWSLLERARLAGMQGCRLAGSSCKRTSTCR